MTRNSQPLHPALFLRRGDLCLRVRLSPGAGADNLGEVRETPDGPALSARVTAPPEKGKANQALIRLVAKKLRLPKGRISLIAGTTGRVKTLCLTGDAAMLGPDITARLAPDSPRGGNQATGNEKGQ
ncbi:DUF167 domain-containing protein [Yunchengibacter salinarum]|uniref:DUF167 domain-containing protein n=1 Tax=Yunchengibacter salinarum TaxID=3133399 RepID=UPI0035B643F1